MNLIWSIIWGIMEVGCIYLSFNYMISRMKRKDEGDADTSESSFIKADQKNLKSNTRCIAVLIFCGIFSTICGYFASCNAIGIISMVKLLLSMTVLTFAAIIDIEDMIIPNECSLVLIVGRVLLVLVEYIVVPDTAFIKLGNSVISLMLTFVCLFVMNRLTRGGLGMGDVKLLSSLGFMCGIQASFVTLMLSFLLCIPVCLYLVIFKKKQLSVMLPLGPFIWIGFGLAIILAIL